MNSAMQRLSFLKLKADECLYFKKIMVTTVDVLLYVDDVLVVGELETAVIVAKYIFMQELEMKVLGVAKFFLGVEFLYSSNGVSLRQE